LPICDVTEEQAADALRLPAEDLDVAFEADALDEIVQVSRGHPYFLQEWGYHVWNAAPWGLAARVPSAKG
jgi:hypothetical protein